jgi:hypothetical protein
MDGDDSRAATKEELVTELAKVTAERDMLKAFAEAAIEEMSQEEFSAVRRRMDEYDAQRGIT